MSASFSRPLAGRALHLRFGPRPANLAESRAVVRLLSKFGEVEYYRNMKYEYLSHPHAALVIFREEAAAARFRKQCPVGMRLGSGMSVEQVHGAEGIDSAPTEANRQEEDTGPFSPSWLAARNLPDGSTAPSRSLSNPFSSSSSSRSMSTSAFDASTSSSAASGTSAFEELPTPPQRPIQMPQMPEMYPFNVPGVAPPTSSDEPTTGKVIRIFASRARARFRDQIIMGHYYGPFAVDTKIPSQQDLSTRVPVKGLSVVNWHAPAVPWRINQRVMDGARGSRQRLGLLVPKDGARIGPRQSNDPWGT